VSRRAALARALRTVELVLIASGLALLGVYAVARAQAVIGRAQALEAFEVAQLERTGEPQPAGVGAVDAPRALAGAPARLDVPDQSLWAKNRIAAYQASMNASIGSVLAVLEIPSIDLRVPVFEGTSEAALNRGVGRIEGTAAIGAPDNLGIAGHRDGFFRGLKDIAVGHEIDVQSLDETVRYRVTELMIVEPEDVYVLAPTDGATLTLVTCYPFYFIGDAPQRFIVKAVADAAPN
jgi:sortase A